MLGHTWGFGDMNLQVTEISSLGEKSCYGSRFCGITYLLSSIRSSNPSSTTKSPEISPLWVNSPVLYSSAFLSKVALSPMSFSIFRWFSESSRGGNYIVQKIHKKTKRCQVPLDCVCTKPPLPQLRDLSVGVWNRWQKLRRKSWAPSLYWTTEVRTSTAAPLFLLPMAVKREKRRFKAHKSPFEGGTSSVY